MLFSRQFSPLFCRQFKNFVITIIHYVLSQPDVNLLTNIHFYNSCLNIILTALTSPLVIQGTNDQSFVNPSVNQPVRNKIALIEGDSISDSTGGQSNWIPLVQTAVGTNWLLQSSAIVGSQISASGNPSIEIPARAALTLTPFHDPTRGQEAAIIWGGTNDLVAGASAATTFGVLQTFIASLKTAGWVNIAIITTISRGNGGAQAAFETARQAYNTLIKAAYGSIGTDPTVTVLDIGGDATLGLANSWQNALYFPDGTHPRTTAASTIIAANYVTPWIASLPNAQGVIPGILSLAGTGTGTVSLAMTAATQPTGACTYQVYRSYTAGVVGSPVATLTGANGAVTVTDTGRQAATFWYTVRWTDTLTHVDSNQVAVALATGVAGGTGSTIKSGQRRRGR